MVQWQDIFWTWWRHQIETFSVLLAICAGNSLVSGEFPAQRPVTRSFDVFFDLCPNKRLSKQLWGWWFETPSGSLWRHSNDHELPSAPTSVCATLSKILNAPSVEFYAFKAWRNMIDIKGVFSTDFFQPLFIFHSNLFERDRLTISHQ